MMKRVSGTWSLGSNRVPVSLGQSGPMTPGNPRPHLTLPALPHPQQRPGHRGEEGQGGMLGGVQIQGWQHHGTLSRQLTGKG